MKNYKSRILILLILILANKNYAQTFTNLNFESAQIPNGLSPDATISASAGMPGWTVTFSQPGGTGTQIASEINYDELSLGGGVVSINDINTAPGFVPLQGNYSAYLFGGVFNVSVTISQSGLVSIGAESLLAEVGTEGYNQATPVFTMSLDGQAINMLPVRMFSNYTLYGGDVSSFAGGTALLSITASAVSSSYSPNPVLLDNIQFSPNFVPEPETWALLLCGAALFGVRQWKRKA